jgi:uncharacterized membrane protein
MDARHNKVCDFRLVSTYVPFAMTILRAQVLLSCAFLVAPHVPVSVYVAALLLVVYFDALVHAGVHNSSIGGHLLPVCFAWITQTQGSASRREDLMLALNVLWFVAMLTLLASYTFRRKIHVGVALILVGNAAFVLCRLWLSAAGVSILEMHVRSVGFYVFAFVHFYVFQTRSQWDSATHACIGPHLGLHVFFGDVWFVVASLLSTAIMCVLVYMQNQDHHDSEASVECTQDRRAPLDHFVETEDMAGLLQELLAAKAQISQEC